MAMRFYLDEIARTSNECKSESFYQLSQPKRDTDQWRGGWLISSPSHEFHRLQWPPPQRKDIAGQPTNNPIYHIPEVFERL
jgi:hypothetical protein